MDSVLRHEEVGQAKDLLAPPRTDWDTTLPIHTFTTVALVPTDPNHKQTAGLHLTAKLFRLCSLPHCNKSFS
jgi:hypothetical protein